MTFAGYKSQDLLQPPRREHASLAMPGQRTACAAIQGIWTKMLLGSRLPIGIQQFPYFLCLRYLGRVFHKCGRNSVFTFSWSDSDRRSYNWQDSNLIQS